MKVSHRITRLATAGLLAGALAAPGASARPAPLDSPVAPGSEPVVIEPAPAPSCRASTTASTGARLPSAPAPPVRSRC